MEKGWNNFGRLDWLRSRALFVTLNSSICTSYPHAYGVYMFNRLDWAAMKVIIAKSILIRQS